MSKTRRTPRGQVSRPRRIFNIAAGSLSVLFVLFMLVLNWPASLGGRATWVTVSGTSMLPTLETGDLVVAWRSGDWQIGDVVLYSMDGSPSALIVHRLVSGNSVDGWYAQGDNKPHIDPWLIPDSHIFGKEIVSIPNAGWVLAWLKGPQVLAVLAGLLVFWAVMARSMAVRRLSRLKVDDPALVNGMPATVTDLHAEGARICIETERELIPPLSIDVWVTDPGGDRSIVHGLLEKRYDIVRDGRRFIGGPVVWATTADRARIDNHYAGLANESQPRRWFQRS